LSPINRLQYAVQSYQPTLLVIDPLRLATSEDLTDAKKVVPILERASRLQQENTKLGILLVHHLKKGQGDTQLCLKDDPREWIDRSFGSQALLAHVETIIGLEQGEERQYTLATVPRSYEPLIWALEKENGSERFAVAQPREQLTMWPTKLRQHWEELPQEFSWTVGKNIVGNSTLDRIIRKATPLLLTQDPKTKIFTKLPALN